MSSVRKIPSIMNKVHLNKFNDDDNSFHELLDSHLEEIVKFFEQHKDFQEIMPDINKDQKVNFLYKRLIYKGMKFQSPFMKALMKMIKKSEEKNKIEVEKRKLTGLYKLSSLELLKLKKNKLENLKKSKLKDLKIKNENSNSSKYLIRSFSNFNSYMTSKIPKFNLNSSLNDSNYSFNNSNNKNFSMTNRFSKNSSKSPNSKELSTYYISDTNFKNSSMYSFNFYSPKNNKATYIVDKCLEEIDSGNSLAENFGKLNKSYSKSIQKHNKTIELMSQTKIFNLDTNRLRKYKKLELNNLNEIKRKLNEKISTSFAFQNRKGYNRQMKQSESTNAYYIYLHDMERTNERLEKQRSMERKNIKKLENLCEDEYKKKEYLKKRIDIFNRRHRNEKKIQKIISQDEFFLTNKKFNDKKNEGFLPKLIKLREQCLKEITVGNFFSEKKKKN